MSAQTVAAIGELTRVQGFGLAGALVLPAGDPAAATAAWRSLPDDVAVVILTPAAARALGSSTVDPKRLTVVMPS